MFAQFADPKVLHFSCLTLDRHLGKASRVLSCASLLSCGWDWEEEEAQSWLNCPKGLKHRYEVWVLVSTHPLSPNQTNATLSDLLWPLRHVLFLTPSWNWLSSSKDQVLFLFVPYSTPAPCEERVNIFFLFICFLCWDGFLSGPRGSDVAIAGWVCTQKPWLWGLTPFPSLHFFPSVLPIAIHFESPFKHVFQTCH